MTVFTRPSASLFHKGWKSARLACLTTAAIGPALLSAVSPASAGEADVLAASASQDIRGTWTVSATILHADTGWDHYADRFDVLAPDGTVLGSRTLFHPHVEEQPFTRSLSSLSIPEDVDVITVRAHDNVHELGGETVEVVLER